MKVYVPHAGRYSDYTEGPLFENERDAKDYCEKQNRDKWGDPWEYYEARTIGRREAKRVIENIKVWDD